MEKIKKYIYEQVISQKISKNEAALMLKELYENQGDNNKDIAVIGMDCRLPKANNANEFWDNLINGIDCIGDIPENRREDIESYFKNKGNFTSEDFIKQGYINDISGFDPAFFNISPAEANMMDPVQRLFLMVVWGALEDAGINFSKISGSKTGVFVGKAHLNEPLYKDFIDDFDMIAFNGSATGILSSRISYLLNLNGPSLVIDTACSSSLVALHTACQSLINNDCEVAIAGGVRVMLLPVKDNKLEALESPDCKLRPFDNEANGTVWGEGVSAVVLKPLSKAIKDRDNIYAVIKGSACNNDGASNGISAPNAYAQEKLIADLWEKKKINPESISYIEAHGTGTALGDPIEIKGITNAFRRYTNKKQICAIGTAKGNIGHLVASSGLAGLIKVLMAMKHKKIPPTINFNEPNAYINFIESPVYFNDRTIEWKDDERPLRASVSSFGISGTNSYVIVEEPPKPQGKSNIAVSKDLIFTLSAKSSTSLKNLISKYVDFLKDETGYDLEDVCFTVNIGRVHHNHRVAIVGNSIAELKGKLAILNKGDLRSVPSENIYCGDFRLVSDTKREKTDGLITKSDKKKLDELSKSKTLEYVDCGKNESSLLNDLCDLYVSGADIPWDNLFAESEARKISLPKYQFELKRCWPENRGNSVIEAKYTKSTPGTGMVHWESDEIHPLLGRLYLRTLNQDIYINDLNPSLKWVIGEHKVAGNFAMPGVSFIEMALCIGRKYFDTKYIRLADMAVIFPLMLREGETKRVQTIVNRLNGYLEFAVVGETEDADNSNGFIEYVQGKIYPLEQKAEKKLDIVLLTEGMNKLGKINPNNYTQGFIQFGSRWTDCVALSTGKTSATVELALPEKFAEDLEEYYLHPALLDMALNALALTVKERYLPFAYKNINIYGPTPSKFYSYIHNFKDSDQRQEMKSYNIDFIDSQGNVFAEIEEYTIKKANNIANMEADTPMFYNTKWVQKDFVLNEAPVTPGKAIVFKDNHGLGDDLVQELKNSGWQVIEVGLGTQYTKTDNNRYEISVDESDHIAFLNEANLDGLTHVFHLFTANDIQEVEDTVTLTYNLEKSVYSLFSLTKHLIVNAQKKKLDIYIISKNVNPVTGNEKFLQPQYACIFGLAKVINNEYPDFRCKSIDSDGSISAKDITSIIGCSDIEAQVAFRDRAFYTEEIRPMRTDAIPEERVEISSDGVYVITGGTGGIGLEICRYLATCCKVNLALVNRSSLPERELWDEILQKNEDSRLCNILEKLRAIELLGSQIICYSADVSEYEQMKAVLEDLRRKFGRIRGIVHSAGIAGQGLLMNKDLCTFKNVIKPKVYGAWILDKLTENEQLDMFVLFSSIASFVAYPGQGDYTAANSFLDAFSTYCTKKGRKMLSINWPAWSETGMAVSHGVNIDMMFKPISTEDAINAFGKIIHKSVDRAIIGELDYESSMFEKLQIGLSKSIRGIINKHKNSLISNQKNIGTLADVVLKGRKDNDYTQAEIKVAKIWGNIFGLQEVNIFDNFYDLGGDSVFAMKLVNSLNKHLNINLSIVDVLNYQSVNDLGAYLDEKGLSNDSTIELNDVAVLKHADDKEFYPVTSQQKAIYLLYQRLPENISYNTPIIINIEGNPDIGQFEQIFRQLVLRHECLRTSFHMHKGVPVFKVHDDVTFDIKYSEAVGTAVEEIINSFIRPYCLEEPTLPRVEIVKTGHENYLLMLDVHHIIADRTSVGIMLNDFFNLLKSNPLTEIAAQYKDYAEWQYSYYNSEAIKKTEEYWLDVFKGEIPLLDIPTDYKRPPILSYEGESVKFSLDEKLCDSLNCIASTANTTINMILTSAFYILLNKLTSQEDIVIGCNVMGRTHEDIQNTMGMYVNTIPVRSCINGNMPFKTYLDNVKNSCLLAYDNQNYPIDVLLEKLDFKRIQNRNPLFDVCFNMMNIPDSIDSKKEISLQGLVIKPVDFENKTAKFDITLSASLSGNKVEMFMEYRTCLFQRNTIENFIKYYIEILEVIKDDINISLNDILLKNDIAVIKYEAEDEGDFILD